MVHSTDPLVECSFTVLLSTLFPLLPEKAEKRLWWEPNPKLFWEIDKIGYTRVVSEQNRVPFFRDGARLRTSAKRLQNAFWRLNPLRLVCAQRPKPFFRCSTPQNSANDGAQKVLFTNNPILFILHPILFIPHPILFMPHPILFDFAKPAETRKRTSPLNPARKIFHTIVNWQVADCDDCDAAAAALLTSWPTKIRRD